MDICIIPEKGKKPFSPLIKGRAKGGIAVKPPYIRARSVLLLNTET
jgi:hypothetical protein